MSGLTSPHAGQPDQPIDRDGLAARCEESPPGADYLGMAEYTYGAFRRRRRNWEIVFTPEPVSADGKVKARS